MNIQTLLRTPAVSHPAVKNQQFLDDVTDLFANLQSGHMNVYVYGNAKSKDSMVRDHWGSVIDKENTGYYLPTADNDLIEAARRDIRCFVPQGTALVDLGVGEAFSTHALPLLTALESETYYGLDICPSYLDATAKRAQQMTGAKIVTRCGDFFDPQTPPPASSKAIGLMMCSTIGNLGGPLADADYGRKLVAALKNLSRLCGKGWLLLSVDTNQDGESNVRGYQTPDIERFVLSILDRVEAELPCEGFDPSLFTYEPKWIARTGQLAHIARATQDQSFMLDGYQFLIQRGQNLHLLNSYKFSADFFEDCCQQAGLDVLHMWDHASPLKLFLLKDKTA